MCVCVCVCVRVCVCICIGTNFSVMILMRSSRLHVPVAVRYCMTDYFIEITCIYACALLCFLIMLNFMCLFIIMSIIVMRHELWCTVRSMRLSKCSIIIIHYYILNVNLLGNTIRLRDLSCLLHVLDVQRSFTVNSNMDISYEIHETSLHIYM